MVQKRTKKRTLIIEIIIVLLARKRKVLYLNTIVPRNILSSKKEISCPKGKYDNRNRTIFTIFSR